MDCINALVRARIYLKPVARLVTASGSVKTRVTYSESSGYDITDFYNGMPCQGALEEDDLNATNWEEVDLAQTPQAQK